MHKYFIAGIISVSLTIATFSASAASAADRQTTNLLAGLAGLAIVGAIINESNQKRKADNYVGRDTYVHQPRYQHRHVRRAPARGHKYKRRAHRQGYGNGYRQYNRRPHH